MKPLIHTSIYATLLVGHLSAATHANTKEVFEVNTLVGRGTDVLAGYDWVGASVAGGFRRDEHLIQLEVAGLSGETNDYAFINTNPWHPTQTILDSGKYYLESIPVWVNYRYGINFGPRDAFRLEAGPTLGAQVIRLTNESRIQTVDTGGTTTNIDQNFRESSGQAVFNYGIGITLSYQISRHWGARIGYRHIQGTRAEFRQEIDPLTENVGGTKHGVYRQVSIQSHGTNYFNFGIEYTF